MKTAQPFVARIRQPVELVNLCGTSCVFERLPQPLVVRIRQPLVALVKHLALTCRARQLVWVERPLACMH